MNRTVQVFILGFTIILSSCSNNLSEKKPETEMEKVSYIIAYNFAKGLKTQGLDSIDVTSVSQAYKDVFAGNESFISEDESKKIMQVFSEKMRTRQAKEVEASITIMNEWLSDTIKAQETQTTESGLQYQVITEANGPNPSINDKVMVHYYGTLADGTKFDSSFDRGNPTELGVNQVIPGWTEALQLMSVGSKWKLLIPSELAYGAQGAGGTIPPNTDIYFILELISINK
jgi:FKBP-type peptidyl-prolyl cis-trans isomerase FklB